MSVPSDSQGAFAYRPKGDQPSSDSSEPPPSPPNYALTGFIFSVNEPARHLRRLLENPSVDFCAVPADKTETVINTLVVLFRTLNYYVHFKDMTNYMSVVAQDLGWTVFDCRPIVRLYVRARETFTSVLWQNPAHIARHQGHDSDKVRLLGQLVDQYISSKPVYRTAPQSRQDFFDLARASWRDILEDPSILDPMRIIEPPRVINDEYWPAAADRSVDIGLTSPHSRYRSLDRATSRRGFSSYGSYGPRRDGRSISPTSNADRRCSTSRSRSPLRHQSPDRRHRSPRSSSTVTQRLPRYGGQRWSPPRPFRYRSPVRRTSRRSPHARGRSPYPRARQNIPSPNQDVKIRGDESRAGLDNIEEEDAEIGEPAASPLASIGDHGANETPSPLSPGSLATELVAIVDHMKQARTRAQNLDLERWPKFKEDIAAFVNHVQSNEEEADRIAKQMDSVLD